jgi:hypothetical protein
VSDRRNRQAREAKDNLEHTKYLVDKAESRAESYLLRMRNGYAEGAKLFFDMFKTKTTTATTSRTTPTTTTTASRTTTIPTTSG